MRQALNVVGCLTSWVIRRPASMRRFENTKRLSWNVHAHVVSEGISVVGWSKLLLLLVSTPPGARIESILLCR